MSVSVSLFGEKKHHGIVVPYSRCKRCRNRQAKARDKETGYSRLYRQRLDKRARIVKQDCRKSDMKHGRHFDLDLETVQKLLSRPCSYCHLSGVKMTLDRIDNGIGHSKNNVLPACRSCNYLRRDMPYAAWMTIVPALQKAVIDGLLPGWGVTAFMARVSIHE